MRFTLVRLPRLWLLMALAALVIAIEPGFNHVVGNLLFDLANVNAVKTLLGKNDDSLSAAAQGYVLANRWFPQSDGANAIVLATLRAKASCLVLRPEDFIDQKARLTFQGRCLWLAGDRTQAVQVWRQADVSPALIQLADYDKVQGQFLDAQNEYTQALAVTATLKGWLALGDLYERMERWQEADQTYEQAILFAPDSALAYQAIAIFRAERGLRDERTEQEFQTAIRLALADPQTQNGISLPWLYTDLALIYIQTGRPKLADDAARRAIALDPRIASSHYYLGEALRLQGDAGGAITELNRALDLGSMSVWVRFSLAMAYLDAGDIANAKMETQRLSEIDPQFEGLPTLYDRIR